MKNKLINRTYISSVENLPYYLDLKMVAGLTGMNYETVKRYCQKGIIKGCKIGKEWRVSQDEFLNMGLDHHNNR